MPTTVSQANQDKITELNAKIKFVQNKLKEIKDAKSVEVEVANTNHKDALSTIDGDYATQISTLEIEITNLQTQLEGIK